MSVLDEILEFERLWEKIKGRLVTTEFKTPSPSVTTTDSYPQTQTTPSAELPSVESTAPIISELAADGIDFNKVDYLKYGTLIKGKGYIEKELWGQYDKILFAAGYKYSKEEKGWIFQPGNQKQEQSQPKKATPTKNKGSKVTRISDITPNLKNPTIEGQLLDDPSQKDVDTRKGPTTVTSFRVDDGSAICRVSVWGALGNSAINLGAGDRVRITSLMVKEPYNGMPQVSAGEYSKITQL